MALVRRSDLLEPWFGGLSLLSELQRQMDEVARRTLGDLGGNAGFMIPVDVLARDNDMVVRAELPGIDPERDVEVKIENGLLHIHGERREEHKEEGERFFRLERRQGAFIRTIPLPEGVNEDQIQATYNDGVLEVVVPGAAQVSGGKRIPVQITGKLNKTLAKGKNGARKKK